jgi:hypothetical protein
MLINWFEMKAEFVATWSPRRTLEGWHGGADANGDIIGRAVYGRALEIQESWRGAVRRSGAS